ncbi:MAG TPA: hypothetical protein PLD84_04435 [Chitinophagales bacterium]|nr:hypothetical protein [Chitinophagales bacterium]
MLKRSSFWLKGAILFQALTTAAHSLSFFFTPEGTNDTERQLIELMKTYKTDMGGGFAPSTQDIFTSFSACFALLYALGALMNGYLLRRKIDDITLKGIVNINLVVFGICFVVMASFTFLPPIVLTGMVFLCLVICRLTFSKT